jgi:hypothetical protein
LSTAGAIPYVTSSGVLGQDATNLFYDSTNKRLGVGTASPGAFLDVAASSATAGVRVSNGSLNQNPQMRVEGYATVKLQSLNTATDSRGAVGTESNNTLEFIVNNSGVARFATTGNLLIGGTTDGNYKLEVANSGTSGTARFYDATATTGSTKVVVRAGAGQSGNILEVQNNAGATLASIASTGYVATPQVYLTGDWLNLTSTTADMASGYVLRFSSTGAQSGTKDLGLARAAAGYLKVTDGSTGLGKIVVSQTTPAASTDACTAGALWADASYVYACTSSGVIKRATLATF